ncbi:MAG: hypothetical protein MEP57_08010 [Microvirga sp.]|nr:hypothetical protein [Microvirga sp.]
MTGRAKLSTFARRAAIVALLYAFALSGLVTGLASALHAAPSPGLADLCRVEASGAPARAPGRAPVDAADCCLHACRIACAGLASAPPARPDIAVAIDRTSARVVGPIAASPTIAPRLRLAPSGPRGPPLM